MVVISHKIKTLHKSSVLACIKIFIVTEMWSILMKFIFQYTKNNNKTSLDFLRPIKPQSSRNGKHQQLSAF